MTSRWLVEVAPERDLEIKWKSISLLVKNKPPEDSDYYGPVLKTHKMLRVFESVLADEGNGPAGDFYTELGRRIHHDQDRDFDVADALSAVGIDTRHAAALDDESWDPKIQAAMDDGLGLVGDDVGTPIIAFENSSGIRNGIFGPVISRRPTGDDVLGLWDGMAAMMNVDGFWELKRTRTQPPDFGERP